jgi:phosphate transport system substrate-binding protein
MKNRPLSIQNEFRSCHHCGYDGNLINAESCEVCKRPLDKFSPTRKETRKVGMWLSIALFCLGAVPIIVGGMEYWKWRQQASPSSKIAAEIRTPDIKLYPTMKDVPNVPKGLFSYNNAVNFTPTALRGLYDAIQEAHPEFRLRYTEPLQGNPGSTTAIRMLIDKEVSFAISARPLDDVEMARARARDINIHQTPIAIDAVPFYTHTGVNIPGISLSQLQDIYSGKITNWKELGGPNVAIVPLLADPKATSAPKQALGDVAEKLSPTVQIVRGPAEAIQKIRATPGSICFTGGLSVIKEKSVRFLSLAKANSDKYVSPVTKTGAVNEKAIREGSYPLTRKVFIITRHNGGLDEQGGIAYANLFLSGEGQQIIEGAGFVPLY